jgi:hypothetical protein
MKKVVLAIIAGAVSASVLCATPPLPDPYSRKCPTFKATPPLPDPYSRKCPTFTNTPPLPDPYSRKCPTLAGTATP